MVTTTETTPEAPATAAPGTAPRTSPAVFPSAGGGRCDGCPRCSDADSGFCKQPHPQYRGLHPVCMTCGHCVLRGKHRDDAQDLERDGE